VATGVRFSQAGPGEAKGKPRGGIRSAEVASHYILGDCARTLTKGDGRAKEHNDGPKIWLMIRVGERKKVGGIPSRGKITWVWRQWRWGENTKRGHKFPSRNGDQKRCLQAAP
jgi:hypothetical protein